MPVDRSEECGRLAADCLVTARQTSDLKIRVFLVEMAQKWLDRVDFADRQNADQHRVIQEAIGDQLRQLHRLTNALPPHLLALLATLNGGAGGRNGEA
jgi:hypothetical protein